MDRVLPEGWATSARVGTFLGCRLMRNAVDDADRLACAQSHCKCGAQDLCEDSCVQ